MNNWKILNVQRTTRRFIKTNAVLAQIGRLVCTCCFVKKDISEYRSVVGRKHGVYEKCRTCEPWYKKFRHVMTLQNFLLACKINRCDICDDILDKICIDHCHKSNTFRGVLCNLAIGLLRDNPIVAQNAFQYLQRGNQNVSI